MILKVVFLILHLLIDDTLFVCLIDLFEEYLFTLVYFGYNVRLSEIRRRSGQGK